MLQRALPYIDAAPPLAMFFKNATKDVFLKLPYIPKTTWPTFRAFSSKLKAEEIGCRDYAFIVIPALKGWAIHKELDHVPVKTFCSTFGLATYQRILRMPSVKLSSDDDELQRLIHNEWTVAQTYIYDNLSGKRVKFSEVVKDLRQYLYGGWVDLYDEGGHRDCRDQVIDMLSHQYNVGFATSYKDLLRQIQCRQR